MRFACGLFVRGVEAGEGGAWGSVCLPLYLSIYRFICISISMKCLFSNVCLYISMYASMHVCMCAYILIQIYLYIHLCMYISCMLTCIHIYVYTYASIFTHTYIPTYVYTYGFLGGFMWVVLHGSVWGSMCGQGGVYLAVYMRFASGDGAVYGPSMWFPVGFTWGISHALYMELYTMLTCGLV